MEIRIAFDRSDPPAGRVGRVRTLSDPSGVALENSVEFVGWLGLLSVLAHLTGEAPQRPASHRVVDND